MTVAYTANRIEYTASSGQTTFAYPFQIYASGDLKVYKNASLLAYSSQYSLTGVGSASGGNVILVTGATSGDKVIILRQLPLEQLTDYVEADAFPALAHETALDKLMMVAQQLKEITDRCLQLNLARSHGRPGLELPAPESLTLSTPGNSKVPRWNAAETNLELFEVGSSVGLVSDTITGSTKAGLPAVGTAGKLRRLTDDERGVWMDSGTVWAAINGEVAEVVFAALKGDDSTDNSPLLSALLDDLPANTEIHFPKGTFRFGAQLLNKLKSGMTIRGAGMGRTILKYTLNPASVSDPGAEYGHELFLQTTSVTDVAFEDLSFTATTTTAQVDSIAEGQRRGHGAIALVAGSRLRLTRVEASNFAGTALVCGGHTAFPQVTDVRYEGLYVHDCYRFGAYVQMGKNVWFRDCRAETIHPYDSNGDGIYDSQWGDGLAVAGCEDVHIAHSTVRDCSRCGIAVEGVGTQKSRDVQILDTIGSGCGWGNPVDTGAAIWCENLTGSLVISGFSLRDNECSIVVTDGGPEIEACSISDGAVILQGHAKTSTKSADFYGGMWLRARHLALDHVTFLQNGASNNGTQAIYLATLGSGGQDVSLSKISADLAGGTNAFIRLAGATVRPLRLVECTVSVPTYVVQSSTGAGSDLKLDDFFVERCHITITGDNPDGYSLLSTERTDQNSRLIQVIGNEFLMSGDMRLLRVVNADTVDLSENRVFVLKAGGTAPLMAAISTTGTLFVRGNEVSGGGALYGNEKLSLTSVSRALIESNRWANASVQHVNVVSATHVLYVNNHSENASTRAITFPAGGVTTALVQGNRAGEAALANVVAGVSQVGNFIANVWTP
jgi:hypothetical protein